MKKLALSLLTFVGICAPVTASTVTTTSTETTTTQPAPAPASSTTAPSSGGASLMSDGPCIRC